MTGYSVQTLSRYGLIALVVAVILGIGQSYITCLLGVAYPTFKSFLTLDHGKAEE